MKDDIRLHLECGCGTHELHFTRDDEGAAVGVPFWYISFWQRGYLTSKPWRYKFRCIWQILRKGEPYGDEVVLEKKDLLELKSYVDEQLAK